MTSSKSCLEVVAKDVAPLCVICPSVSTSPASKARLSATEEYKYSFGINFVRDFVPSKFKLFKICFKGLNLSPLFLTKRNCIGFQGQPNTFTIPFNFFRKRSTKSCSVFVKVKVPLEQSKYPSPRRSPKTYGSKGKSLFSKSIASVTGINTLWHPLSSRNLKYRFSYKSCAV